MNKLIHGTNASGQSIVDRALAAKHTVAGQSLAKVICKATTEEVMGPKRKHLDYLLQCTNEPNVSIPQMANLLIERTQNANWIVVFKALVTVHNLMNYGNERFTQYLASNNCTFNLNSFTDKSGTQGYDMSTYIRRYCKYLNEKAFSYRQMAFDFCKVKRGKEDGLLRTMNADKLLKTLPVLQTHLDALVEFDVAPNDLTNGVINAVFMLLFKDLIRLFACYNDGIINLLEKYFDMNKKQCREALDIYKKFLARMDRVCEFLKVAESVGIDKGDIPDLAKAPSSLLDALEQHLTSLENSKKTGSTVLPKPAAGISAAISTYAAASQVGTAPGAGAGMTQITEEERQRILEEEQRQLDQMKQQRLKQMTVGVSMDASSSSSSSSSCLNARTVVSSSVVTNASSPLNSLNNHNSGSSPRPSSHSDDLFALTSLPSMSFGQTSETDGNDFLPVVSAGNPFATSSVSGTPMIAGGGTAGAWSSPALGGAAAAAAAAASNKGPPSASQPAANHFATDANFAAVFGGGSGVSGGLAASGASQPVGYDGFGEILRPTVPVSGSQGAIQGTPQGTRHDKLLKSDLDSSLASLAGGLNIQPAGQVKKTDHQWTTSSGEKKLTGGSITWNQQQQQPIAPVGPTWNQPIMMAPSSYPPMVQPMQVMGGGMAMMAPYPVPLVQQPRAVGVMNQQQQLSTGWNPIQPQPFVSQRPPQQQQQQQQQQPQQSHSNAPNDPFGAL